MPGADDIMSTFIYEGSQLPILLAYNYRGIINHHTITAFFNNLELTSSITDKSTSYHSRYVKNFNIFLSYAEIAATAGGYIIEGKGIPPDIPILTTAARFINGIDRIFEKGIEIIENLK